MTPRPRYQLRWLLIVLAAGPPVLAWWVWPVIKERYDVWQWQRTAQIPSAFTGEWADGYLGAELDEYPGTNGVTVIGVRPGTPAQAGGLMKDDVITGVSNFICRDLNDFDSVIAIAPAGTPLPIIVNRQGKSKKLVVTLGKRPARP